jgi:pyruvate/2-oxoglutarate dehydrogenase complex dihydrolipoamide acyltransferase (E2) component
MGTSREIFIPDIGDFKNVDVVEVLVKAGDTVKPEQSLISVESDKATMEIPSPAAGVVKEMRVKIGDKVSQGSPILVLEETEAAPAAPAKSAPKPQEAPAAKPAPVLAAVPAPSVPAAPAVARTEPA